MPARSSAIKTECGPTKDRLEREDAALERAPEKRFPPIQEKLPVLVPPVIARELDLDMLQSRFEFVVPGLIVRVQGNLHFGATSVRAPSCHAGLRSNPETPVTRAASAAADANFDRGL